MSEIYGWDDFRSVMQGMESARTVEYADTLRLVRELDKLAGQLCARPLDISEHPVERVLVSLGVRSFRLGIGAIHLGLSGFPDLTPNLIRTIWEIGIRILAIRKNPVCASYGYLIYGITNEMETLNAEIEHRKQKNLELGNLEQNRDKMRTSIAILKSKAAQRGCNPLDLLKRYGKINVREVCKDSGIEKAYLVTYKWESGFIHESGIAEADYITSTGPARKFDLGPLLKINDASVIDAIRNVALVFNLIGATLDDNVLKDGSARILDELQKMEGAQE